MQAIVLNTHRPAKPVQNEYYQQQQPVQTQSLAGYSSIQVAKRKYLQYKKKITFMTKKTFFFQKHYQTPLREQQQVQQQPQRHKVLLTPFLPSNQLPGAFRPIIPKEQQEPTQQNSINLNALNNHYEPDIQQQHIEVIPSTPKPFILATKYEQNHPNPRGQQQQQKYVAYVRPQQQYVQVVKTTPRPTSEPEGEQYVYHVVEHIPVPTSTRKPAIKVYKNSYKIQTHSEPLNNPEQSRLPANDQFDSLFANIKYVHVQPSQNPLIHSQI